MSKGGARPGAGRKTGVKVGPYKEVKKVNLTIRAYPDDIEKLRKMAAGRKMSVSKFIVAAILGGEE